MISIVLSGLALALVLWQNARIARMERRVQSLEQGTVPDYEKAKDAANAINDFNSGITGILGFDPYDALKAQRGERVGGEGR